MSYIIYDDLRAKPLQPTRWVSPWIRNNNIIVQLQVHLFKSFIQKSKNVFYFVFFVVGLFFYFIARWFLSCGVVYRIIREEHNPTNREASDSGDGPWPPVKRVDCGGDGGVVGGSGSGTNQDGYIIILVTSVYR